jgi:uncharacterized protein (DUF1501 family)
MSSHEPTTSEVMRAISSPLPADPSSLSRRHFLQAAVVAAGAAAMPMWLSEAAQAAVPLGPGDGVLVLITMSGGNDGLNTVIPISQGAYYDHRRNLAITPSNALVLNDERALHPNLRTVGHLWNDGDVAIIEGVGNPGVTDLSHFSAMARLMAATAGDNSFYHGWLGRFIDDLPGGDDPFHAVNIGTSIPLVVQGRHRQAAGLPDRPNGVFKINGADSHKRRQHAALAAFAGSPTGRGALADAVAVNGARAVEVAADVEPVYAEDLPEGTLQAKLDLAARLINANLGIRVLTLSYGDFDGHAGHAEMHGARMRELDEGLQIFYDRLHPSFGARTIILAVSEFGRRVNANGSQGVDHGAGGTMLAIGTQVRGGFYGQLPSLTALDRRGNLKPTVDFRSVFATVLDGWLEADSRSILGGSYEDLGFVAPPSPTRTTSKVNPVTVGSVFTYRAQVVRLYRAYFGRSPDSAGLDHWVEARRSGLALTEVSEALAASAEFRSRYGHLTNREFVDLVYRNVLARAPDAAGLEHWTTVLDQGTGRGEVMVGFSESQEHVDTTRDIVDDVDRRGPVARLYQAYFERPPDDDGLRHWIGASLSYEAISDAFAASGEFQERYGRLSDAEFVDLVYENVLGRSADDVGRRHWLARLATGTSRGAVMLGFSESPEFIERTATLP